MVELRRPLVILVSAHHDLTCGDRNLGMVSGIESLGAVASAAGCDVKLLCGPRSHVDLPRWPRVREASLVGISSTTKAWPHARAVARAVREAAPRAPIVVGGVHGTVMGSALLLEEPSLDMVARGDGEEILLDLIRGVALRHIAGLSFRHVGRIVDNPERKPVADLDRLPRPLRGRLEGNDQMQEDFGIYHRAGLGDQGRAAYLVVARGCGRGCTFCHDGRVHPRRRTAESVTAEVDDLARAGYRFVNLVAPNFAANGPLARAVAAALGRAGIRWNCYARPEDLTPDMCDHFRTNGCAVVECGVESSFPGLRKLYGKRTPARRVLDGLMSARQAGLMVRANLVIAPVPDLAYVEREMEFLKSAGVDFVSVNPLIYLPGTELQARAVKDGRLRGTDRGRGVPMHETDAEVSAAMLHEIETRFYRRFYYRTGYLLRQLSCVVLCGRLPVRGGRLWLAWAWLKALTKALSWTLRAGALRRA